MKISVFQKTKQAGSYTLALVLLSADKALVKTFNLLYTREKTMQKKSTTPIKENQELQNYSTLERKFKHSVNVFNIKQVAQMYIKCQRLLVGISPHIHKYSISQVSSVLVCTESGSLLVVLTRDGPIRYTLSV